jgi:hypothetical protein
MHAVCLLSPAYYSPRNQPQSVHYSNGDVDRIGGEKCFVSAIHASSTAPHWEGDRVTWFCHVILSRSETYCMSARPSMINTTFEIIRHTLSILGVFIQLIFLYQLSSVTNSPPILHYNRLGSMCRTYRYLHYVTHT